LALSAHPPAWHYRPCGVDGVGAGDDDKVDEVAYSGALVSARWMGVEH
jgi:hypothetical protein